MSQPKLFRNNIKQVSILATIAILGTITILSAFFLVSDSASDSYATSANSEITAEVDGTHYVTLSAPDVTFSINPTDSAQLSKQNINVSVETNAPGGADLYLSMANSTNALHLNGDTTSTAPAIKATSSSVVANSLVANTWGYSTDDQTYSAVPTSDSDPALLAAVDGSSVGSNAGGVITASIPVYYAANVDTSIPAGSYSNRLAYSAVVDGGIITEATLTKIEIDGAEVYTMQPEVENTLEVTTNLMTNTYGTPRVYLETTDPAGYQECGDVVVGRNESGYMKITCKVTPTQAATGVTLHIVPKGSSDDRFCTDGTYTPDTSDCEAGDWKWGSFVIEVGDIERRPKNFDEIEFMQHMTPEICASANEGDTKQLVDQRDNKKYWVAKLADGNCWMTQNLDLDLNTVGTLTPENSDVSEDWDFTTKGGSWYNSADQGSTDYSAIQGWDLGEYVKTSPTATTSCTSYSDLSECKSQFTEVTSGMTPYAEAVNEGKTPAENVAVSENNYDTHYLVGNYYSWPAATAGSGNSVSNSGDAADSICPANWRLPLSGGSNTETGSFYNLLNQYGLTDDPVSGNNNITTSPLYFVRSGYVFPSSGRLLSAGYLGDYWSGRANSSNNAYELYFLSSYVVTPSSNNYRYLGFSVRCVANWG